MAKTVQGDVLVFGGQGQLGFELVRLLREHAHVVYAPTRQALDIQDGVKMACFIQNVKPSFILNAAAYNDVDRAQVQRDLAMGVNAFAPGVMAQESERVGATLVHFSTDYVFGHGHSVPIDETCVPSPLSVYGMSKLCGEERVLSMAKDAYVVRVCGLYGWRRHNFIKTMIRLSDQAKPISVVADQIVSPTWVEPLASWVLELCRLKPSPGVYHCVSQGCCSWYDYAQTIFKGLGLEPKLVPTTQKEWARPAPRPSYSVLTSTQSVLGKLEPWDVSLHKFLQRYGHVLLE